MPAISSAASISSSRSSHRMTPAASRAASVTRSSPARLPLCAMAAACAWRDRPTLTARIGLPSSSARSREGEEPLGPLEALDEQHDGVGLGVVEAVGEVVAQVEDHLGADGHDPAVPDPRARRVDERVGDAPRLGEPGDVATREPRVHVADVVGAVGRPVDHAHAVGPEERDAVADRDRRGPSRCIAAAASPPSTTPPPGMTRLGTPASAASCAKRAARSGFTARITVSGRSGSASSVG